MPLDDPDNPLAIEIQQETAAAYFVACRKMVDALAALQAFDAVVASSGEISEPSQQRCELLESAVERVYYVVIQREAMKLSCSEGFFEVYGVPAEVRARLGPRQRK
jgi:hypothetical protein